MGAEGRELSKGDATAGQRREFYSSEVPYAITGFRFAILSKGEWCVGFSPGKAPCKWHLREAVLKVIGYLW